jgi:FKBP-type peptidyl-prolyl cis-trans isomerase SlyD
MKIGANAVVAIDYTLTDDGGEVLETSEGDAPLVYLHGHKQIVPGLEAALDGKGAGDALQVVVPPAEGYGEKTTEVVRVPRDQLPEDAEPEVGMELEEERPDGTTTTLWVVGVEKDAVLLTTDHPLAGVTLHFDITVREVRAATREELDHGHVHGDDDEHHHHH